MKNDNDTSVIEPATFRFVTQHLNHCATAIPHTSSDLLKRPYGPVWTASLAGPPFVSCATLSSRTLLYCSKHIAVIAFSW